MWPGQDGTNWDLSNDGFIHRDLDSQGSPSAFNIDFLPNLGPMETGALTGGQPQQAISSFNDGPRMPSSGSKVAPKKQSKPLSLDQKADHSTTFIGYSNESDPFALNHFPHNQQDEVDFFRVTYRKVSADNDSSIPLHFLQSQTATAVEARKLVDGCLPKNDDRQSLENLVDRTNGVALVKL